MAFTHSPEMIARSVPRSVSNGMPGQFQHRATFGSNMVEQSRRVHLISSDLWEAITGERLTPANICQILDSSIPQGDSQTTHSIQQMQYIMMARDKHGSRMLQGKLEQGNTQERAFILNSLLPHLNELVYDPSANFVVQKMCEYLKPDQQRVMLEFFLDQRDAVIEHPNGCRVLQKFIEYTDKETIDRLFLAVKGNLVKLCFNQNGNHIVQRFVENLPNRVSEIVGIIQPYVVDLVVDNCGCRVVQKLFDRFDISVLELLVKEVLKNAAELATNQYGNYVVQNILEAGKPGHVTALIRAFKGKFYDFSVHKFASNVIEKCIRGATQNERYEIFSEIIGSGDDIETNRILKMVCDQFGNYVIQRIMEYGSEDQVNAISEVVYDNYNTLIVDNYAKHVIARLEDQREF